MRPVEQQLRSYAEWVQRTWPDDAVLATDAPPEGRPHPGDQPDAAMVSVAQRRSKRLLLVAAALVAVLGIGIGAFFAFGSTDRATVETASTSTPPARSAPTDPEPTTSTTAAHRVQPVWQPDHLSADGRTLTIGVIGNCGQAYEGIETTVDESPDKIEIAVAAAPLVLERGCPEPRPPTTPVEIALTMPLGEREIVDAADPDRPLPWVVEPGSVSAQVIVRSEPGAVAADVPDDLFLVVGVDGPMVPLRVDQVREGMWLPGRLTFAPGDEHMGVFGSIEQLPLDDDFVPQGSLPIPAPDPATAYQQLAIELAPGAITAEGRRLLVDPALVTIRWLEDP